MPINILMPALSPTMEKGDLAKWLKKEGEAVKPGDVIAEIETDKATMEVEAVDEGVLAKIVVPEGTADVPVNQLIAVLAGEGEDVKAAAAQAGAAAAPAKAAPTPQPSAPPPAPAAQPTAAPAPKPAAAQPIAAAPPAAPAARTTDGQGGRVFS
jgi:pyruvate dehydrogenase E2 component (dihydrolipoamide acetyltransferase)